MDGIQTNRRVVSIDLDNDEQFDTFVRTYRTSPSPTIGGSLRDALAALLPKPKPEEPTLPGAVVRDGDNVYVRSIHWGTPKWENIYTGNSRQWDQFSHDAEVLFEGVEL